MTLQQLQYIVALDKHRHFVRAAKSCFVAQPTLTLQVQKLEEEIGLIIFDRSTQPIVPTEMGEKFIAKARRIVREIDNLKAMVNKERDLLAGNYRIAVIPTMAPYLLPLFLKDFSESHPEVSLEIKEMQSEEIIFGIQSNTIDIGIMATPLSEKHIREIPLFYEPFLIYAHKDHPILEKREIKISELKEKGLWLLDKGHCFRNQILNICQNTELLYAAENILFESGSIETLKNMVQSHSGYTLIPELAVNENRDLKLIRQFCEPQPAREVSLVVHSSFTKELLLSHLRKSIVTKIPEKFKRNFGFKTVRWR